MQGNVLLQAQAYSLVCRTIFVNEVAIAVAVAYDLNAVGEHAVQIDKMMRHSAMFNLFMHPWEGKISVCIISNGNAYFRN